MDYLVSGSAEMLPDGQKKRKNLVPCEEYMQDRKLWEEDRHTDLVSCDHGTSAGARVLVTPLLSDGFSVRAI